jgi:nucleotide-binding universal stress UspA family protein
MKKILFLVDTLNFEAKMLDFPAYIAGQRNSKLIGLFVKNEATEAEGRHYDEAIENNTQLFRNTCADRGISADIRVAEDGSLENIIEESRYADLLIVDPRLSLTRDTAVPSKFVLQILTESECPVLVAAEIFDAIDEVIFAYDGSKSSAFAIKQFSYLLPEFNSKKVNVLHIVEPGETAQENTKVQREFSEWLELHFSNVSFTQLSGTAKETLFAYFMEHNERNDKLLVTGAFGRNMLSSFFRHSTAETVLKAIDIPVFVSHI